MAREYDQIRVCTQAKISFENAYYVNVSSRLSGRIKADYTIDGGDRIEREISVDRGSDPPVWSMLRYVTGITTPSYRTLESINGFVISTGLTDMTGVTDEYGTTQVAKHEDLSTAISDDVSRVGIIGPGTFLNVAVRTREDGYEYFVVAYEYDVVEYDPVFYWGSDEYPLIFQNDLTSEFDYSWGGIEETTNPTIWKQDSNNDGYPWIWGHNETPKQKASTLYIKESTGWKQINAYIREAEGFVALQAYIKTANGWIKCN